MADETARDWSIERLAGHHDRSAFDCGDRSLNEFLRRFSGQYMRRNLARTYVAVVAGRPRVCGYYSLASGAVRFEDVPEQDRRRLPRHPVPIARLARLAVDRSEQGRGLGELLLGDAMRRVWSISHELGIAAVAVEAINEPARAFYVRYGFVELVDDRRHPYLPMGTVAKTIGVQGE